MISIAIVLDDFTSSTPRVFRLVGSHPQNQAMLINKIEWFTDIFPLKFSLNFPSHSSDSFNHRRWRVIAIAPKKKNTNSPVHTKSDRERIKFPSDRTMCVRPFHGSRIEINTALTFSRSLSPPPSSSRTSQTSYDPKRGEKKRNIYNITRKMCVREKWDVEKTIGMSWIIPWCVCDVRCTRHHFGCLFLLTNETLFY